jgi:hypothetical protein
MIVKLTEDCIIDGKKRVKGEIIRTNKLIQNSVIIKNG